MKTRSSPSNSAPGGSGAFSANLAKIARERAFGDDHFVSTRIQAELSAQALQDNYRAIHALVPHQALLPMVKANGYGHGAEWAAGLLQGFPALYGFGVATLEEGAALRAALGPRGRRVKIVVFSGTLPWSEEKGRYCELHGLTPVIASDSDWHAFLREEWPERLPYELKFNTGMNRLGLTLNLATSVARSLRSKPAHWHPQGIFSHLAMGERPEARLSQQQRERFVALKGTFSSVCPSSLFHLANSAAIWGHKQWRLEGLTDVVRPGLALYGVLPWKDAPARGLQPVMTLKAPVLAVHSLKAGESLGYGSTYTVPDGESERIAILGAGYGDGIHRALSNRGRVWLGGRAEPIRGIVSMDLCAVRCSSQVKVGDWAEILGSHVDPWGLARAAETIPYEFLTSVSGRVQRKYV